jgi:hypothetical protein
MLFTVFVSLCHFCGLMFLVSRGPCSIIQYERMRGVGFLVPANLNNFHPSPHKSLNQEKAKEIVYRQVIRESFPLDSVWKLKIQFYLYYAHDIGQNVLSEMEVREMFSLIDKHPLSNCYRGNEVCISFSLSPHLPVPRHLYDFVFAKDSHFNCV